MKTLKKIATLVIIALISQIACFESIQAQSTKRAKKQPKHHHTKQNIKTTTQKRKKKTATVIGATQIHNRNQEQERIDNALALWEAYCDNNPADSRCDNPIPLIQT